MAAERGGPLAASSSLVALGAAGSKSASSSSSSAEDAPRVHYDGPRVHSSDQGGVEGSSAAGTKVTPPSPMMHNQSGNAPSSQKAQEDVGKSVVGAFDVTRKTPVWWYLPSKYASWYALEVCPNFGVVVRPGYLTLIPPPPEIEGRL